MTSKTKLSKVLTQFSWIMTGRIFGAILQALMMIWLARDVGPNLFGLFTVVYSLAAVAQVGLDLGLSAFVIRERARNSRSLWTARALRLYDWLAILLSLTSLLGLFLAGTLINQTILMLIPLGIWVAAERNTDAWLGVLLADGDVHINTTNLILRRLAALGLYAAFNLMGLEPLLAFSLSLAISSVASLIAIRPIVSRRLPHVQSRLNIRRTLKFGRPFWLNSLGIQLRNLDAVIVSSISGTVQAGFYGASTRVTGPINMISASLATVLLPLSTGKSTAALNKMIRWCLYFILALSLVYTLIIIILPGIVAILLGDEYLGAILPMRIIIGGLLFSSAASIFTAVLQGAGRQYYVAYTAIVSTIAGLTFIILGSFYAGAVGAALGLAISYIFHCTLLIIGVRKWLTKKKVMKGTRSKETAQKSDVRA